MKRESATATVNGTTADVSPIRVNGDPYWRVRLRDIPCAAIAVPDRHDGFATAQETANWFARYGI